MEDQLDDALQFYRQKDLSAGQFSYQHPTDKIVMPPNGASALTNATIDKLGLRRKRKGYTIIANDLGSLAINGMVGYYPVGGDRQLVMECNGIVYTWKNTGNWVSSQTGLTASAVTELVIAKGLVFRLGQTDNIYSYDGSSWTDEGGATVEGGGVDPPKGSIGIWTSNQRFLVGNTATNPNFVWPSDAGDPQAFGDVSFKFGDRNEQGVTGMFEFTDGEVMVMTEKEMFVWNITDTTSSNWTVKKVADIGCVSNRTMKQLGQDVLFLARDGVRSIVQSNLDKKRGASLPISFPITDWIQRINWGRASQAVAWVWDDNYYLSVPVDAATYNSHVFVFSRRAFEANGNRGGWTIWTNWAANAYASIDFSGIRRLYFGEASADSKVYVARSDKVSEHADSDNGTAISYTEESRRISLDSDEFDKSFNKLEVEALEGDGTLSIEAQIEGEGYIDVGSMPLAADLPTLEIALPFDLNGGNKIREQFDLEGLGRGRNIQIKITEATLDADLQLVGWSLSAFVEGVEFED